MLYDLTITQPAKMLQNLSRCLDKAAAFSDAKKLDGTALLHARLAPDQFHFTRQIQIACDTAKVGVARLTGKEPPVHADDEQTLAALQARIASVVAYLQSYTPADFAGAEERRVSQPRWAGKSLSGKEFALQHMLPNLYFHVATAYSILRHNGVALGKKDYLGDMPFQEPTAS
jgi:hypothetical protein